VEISRTVKYLKTYRKKKSNGTFCKGEVCIVETEAGDLKIWIGFGGGFEGAFYENLVTPRLPRYLQRLTNQALEDLRLLEALS